MRGLYVIKCLVNNTAYVGSTNRLSRRKAEHFNKLRKNDHPNQHLQFAFNKYGENSFIFMKKRYSGVNQADLRTKEDSLLELYKIKGAVFNLRPVNPGRPWGWRPSEEHRRILSETKLGIPKSEEVKRRCSIGKSDTFKAVVGTSLIDGSILSFKSTRDAEKVGFGRKEIRYCCNGIHHKHKNYSWRWA